MRVFYIALANICLPFLLFYLRNFLYKFYYSIILKKPKQSVPELDFKIAFRLFIVGVLLLSTVLFYKRLTTTTENRIPTYEVKEYDFR